MLFRKYVVMQEINYYILLGNVMLNVFSNI